MGAKDGFNQDVPKCAHAHRARTVAPLPRSHAACSAGSASLALQTRLARRGPACLATRKVPAIQQQATSFSSGYTGFCGWVDASQFRHQAKCDWITPPLGLPGGQPVSVGDVALALAILAVPALCHCFLQPAPQCVSIDRPPPAGQRRSKSVRISLCSASAKRGSSTRQRRRNCSSSLLRQAT
jgi:hypothetical protein